MPARYSTWGSGVAGTNTSIGQVVGDATRPRRMYIYDILVGATVSADAQNGFLVGRVTTLGTGAAGVVNALDPGDIASEQDSLHTITAEPTYTANANLLYFGLNQRGSWRWVAAPGGELVTPATAANGVGLKHSTTTGTALNYFTMHWVE